VNSMIERLSVLKGRGHWWWGGGLHQGYRWIKNMHSSPDDLVLMINNDTQFAEDFLQKAVGLLADRPRTLLVAQAHSKKNGRLIDAGVHVNWKKFTFEQAKDAQSINCSSTRGLFLKVRDFLDIGGFHPVILPHYGSDYEFTIRAYRKGYELLSSGDLSLRMDEDATGFHEFEGKISRREFFKKYFSKRSAANPVYWSSFVILACPWPWKGINLLRIAVRSTRTMIRIILKK